MTLTKKSIPRGVSDTLFFQDTDDRDIQGVALVGESGNHIGSVANPQLT